MIAARLVAVLALTLASLLITGVQAAGAAADPKMRFDKRMTVDAVCFTVTNPANGQSSLFGLRYKSGAANASTPAIVLVHGIASSTATPRPLAATARDPSSRAPC